MDTLSGQLWLLGLGLPWLSAGALALLPRRIDHRSCEVGLAGALLGLAALLGAALLQPASPELQTVLRLPWVPGLGLELILVRDGLTLMFALLVAGIAAVVTLYSRRYLPHANQEEGSYRRQSTFYAMLAAFTGSMLLMVSAGHLVLLYLGWELTGLASYGLIGYWHHLEHARLAAQRALVFTVAGGVALLVGLLLLGLQGGSWGLQQLVGTAAGGAPLLQGPLLEVVAALLVLGALAKSAQLPFHNWLPAAMVAPTPVSAFLHSAALVAAGIYLLARFFPLLHQTSTWWWLLVVPGAAGVVLGGVLALRQQRFKGLLAYSTISQYGFMFLALGLGTGLGLQAALYAFFVHAIIKAGLFLVAGAVTHVTGGKEWQTVSGLGRSHKLLTAMSLLLALSLGGIPLTGGFYYKEELLQAALTLDTWLLVAAFMTGSLLSLAYMLHFLKEIFLGPSPEGHPAPLSPTMAVALAVLTAITLGVAVAPTWMAEPLLDPAIAAALGRPRPLHVELKLGTTLLLSLISLAGGVTLLALLQMRRVRSWWERLPSELELGGSRALQVWGAGSRGVLSAHTGYVGHYMGWLFTSLLLLVGLYWGRTLPETWSVSWGAWRPVEPGLVLLLLALAGCMAAIVASRRHLVLGLLLGLAGYALGGVFLSMGAPDVALAQVLVETLGAFSVLFAIHLSGRVQLAETAMLQAGDIKSWRVLLAAGCGGVATVATYLGARTSMPQAIGSWYTGPGHRATGVDDFVAAILTDFRALDTFLEVLVFVAAMLGVVGVLGRRWQPS